MELVYEKTGDPVKVGDLVTLRSGEELKVVYFREPHKPSSSGKVSVENQSDGGYSMEYYVSVIGAHWINREDQS